MQLDAIESIGDLIVLCRFRLYLKIQKRNARPESGDTMRNIM